jgi:hypothetical protein
MSNANWLADGIRCAARRTLRHVSERRHHHTSITAGVASGTITSVIDRNAKFDSANTREFQLQLRVEW